MQSEEPGSSHLKREIGLFGATALGIGAIIGSGIGSIGLLVGGVWFFFHRKKAS
jgi:hypothetical protein